MRTILFTNWLAFREEAWQQGVAIWMSLSEEVKTQTRNRPNNGPTKSTPSTNVYFWQHARFMCIVIMPPGRVIAACMCVTQEGVHILCPPLHTHTHTPDTLRFSVWWWNVCDPQQLQKNWSVLLCSIENKLLRLFGYSQIKKSFPA